jgi:hypothetical protein
MRNVPYPLGSRFKVIMLIMVALQTLHGRNLVTSYVNVSVTVASVLITKMVLWKDESGICPVLLVPPFCMLSIFGLMESVKIYGPMLYVMHVCFAIEYG